MKWEIMITAKHPGVIEEIMHRNARAISVGDIIFISVNKANEED